MQRAGKETVMSAVAIHEFFERALVPYSVLPHQAAYGAQAEAAAAHVSGKYWAKVVVCFVDGRPVQAVVGAPRTVDLDRLLALTGGREIRLAQEGELSILFPDCEPGALPPIGPLYGQPVYVDVELALEPDIAFNAGSHTAAMCVRWGDFARTVRPIVGSFANAM
jgi:Ala-tRNA(Pro) deacylase